MKTTVKEVANLTGVSVRTLHYYHGEGILEPSEIAPNGYRYYDEACLERLQHILFLRELDFSIAEIKGILKNPDFDQEDALRKQRKLLTLKRNRLDNLITILDKKIKGEENMSFKAFDMAEIEESKKKYAKEVHERWGNTEAYTQSQKKTNGYTAENWQIIHEEAEKIYADFLANKSKSPQDPEVQDLVAQWQQHISKHYYDCSDEILAGLGLMYVGDERFTQNIDERGKGLAAFMSDAITVYCSKSTK
ncbi:MerR family transcriptional regulator [Acetobacterium bakii]|uniref:MerR family transcriptional regulator n=1 Tax=Acetobacterium bakii TaxID=52689 RepID=A0A0L6U0T2_9FIRM|nr:MerR family transcriptional regulator [Acetobacterium bakii]KNZ42131.1 MerR family transcriptional regulator [Acetobacterium bakii]